MHGLNEDTYNKVLKVIDKYPDIEFKLFGSRAKNKAKVNSDIDIAVFGEINEKEKFDIKNDFDKLEIPYKVDIVFVDETTKTELLNAILKEGVKF